MGFVFRKYSGNRPQTTGCRLSIENLKKNTPDVKRFYSLIYKWLLLSNMYSAKTFSFGCEIIQQVRMLVVWVNSSFEWIFPLDCYSWCTLSECLKIQRNKNKKHAMLQNQPMMFTIFLKASENYKKGRMKTLLTNFEVWLSMSQGIQH